MQSWALNLIDEISPYQDKGNQLTVNSGSAIEQNAIGRRCLEVEIKHKSDDGRILLHGVLIWF